MPSSEKSHTFPRNITRVGIAMIKILGGLASRGDCSYKVSFSIMLDLSTGPGYLCGIFY
jgi:hypothetical protein